MEFFPRLLRQSGFLLFSGCRRQGAASPPLLLHSFSALGPVIDKGKVLSPWRLCL